MKNSAHFLDFAPLINGVTKPFSGWTVGYSAIIQKLNLPIPYPLIFTMVSEKNHSFENEGWKVFPKSYLPEDKYKLAKIHALYNHLVFALKYEGVNLLVFSKLAETLEEDELLELVSIEPTGQYARRIWFLIEWLSDNKIKG